MKKNKIRIKTKTKNWELFGTDDWDKTYITINLDDVIKAYRRPSKYSMKEESFCIIEIIVQRCPAKHLWGVAVSNGIELEYRFRVRNRSAMTFLKKFAFILIKKVPNGGNDGKV